MIVSSFSHWLLFKGPNNISNFILSTNLFIMLLGAKLCQTWCCIFPIILYIYHASCATFIQMIKRSMSVWVCLKIYGNLFRKVHTPPSCQITCLIKQNKRRVHAPVHATLNSNGFSSHLKFQYSCFIFWLWNKLKLIKLHRNWQAIRYFNGRFKNFKMHVSYEHRSHHTVHCALNNISAEQFVHNHIKFDLCIVIHWFNLKSLPVQAIFWTKMKKNLCADALFNSSLVLFRFSSN